MVGHGIADKTNSQFLRNLLHNSRLPNTRRSHQEDGPLLLHWDNIVPELIFGKIRRHCVLDLFFCLFDVHYFSACFFIHITRLQ